MNNWAETMNAILKRFVNRKESPIDTIVLVLGELSASFYSENLKGRYRRRNFHLQGDFESLYDLEKDCPVLPEIKTTEEFFINFQNSIIKISPRRLSKYLILAIKKIINLHTFRC